MDGVLTKESQWTIEEKRILTQISYGEVNERMERCNLLSNWACKPFFLRYLRKIKEEENKKKRRGKETLSHVIE